MLWLGSTQNCGSSSIYDAKEYMGALKKNVSEVNFLVAVTMVGIPIQIAYSI